MTSSANETLGPLAASRRKRSRADSNSAAVEELFLRCEHRIGRYLLQMVGDRATAADLLQDTFYDAFRARAQFTSLRNPEAWLFAIAHRRALRLLRSKRRFASAISRLTQQHIEGASSKDSDWLQLRDLLVRVLTPEDRALVLLHYLHGFKADELAQIADLTPAAIRQRLARARAELIAADPERGTTPEGD